MRVGEHSLAGGCLASVHLVACVGQKLSSRSLAKDLYTSPWFRKARRYVEARQEPWFILSAKYGLVHPEEAIDPYEATLNKMGVAERRAWAERVFEDLRRYLGRGSSATFLAGENYRGHLLPLLEACGIETHVPMRGLSIGKQLAWLGANEVPGIRPKISKRPAIGEQLARQDEEMTTDRRCEDLKRFYAAMARLVQRVGGFRFLADGLEHIPSDARGVYFFFDTEEPRTHSGVGPRVVRIGTLGVGRGSKSTLRKRLSQHRGTQRTGGGNHRGSVFRLLVGKSFVLRDSLNFPEWGSGSSAARQIRESEVPLEMRVSDYIRQLPYLWVRIDDEAGPNSERAFIERNSIALLSNRGKAPLDPASPAWLGNHSDKAKARESGLWNSNHVDEQYDVSLLSRLERLVGEMA